MKDVPTRTQEYAGYIRELILSTQDPYLPSIRSLSRHFKVDIKVISAATKQLKREGLLSVHVGSRTRICGRSVIPTENLSFPLPQSSSKWLYDLIFDQITSGELRPGQYLPKQSYIMLKHEFSSHTVQKAYRLLCTQGCVHQRGNSWIVGRPQGLHISAPPGNIPVILLIQRQTTSWAALYNERTIRLMSSILAEVESSGIFLTPCCIQNNSDGYDLPIAGREQIESYTRKLGDRFFGSILVGFSRYTDELKDACRSFGLLGKPLVFLDVSAGDPVLDLEIPRTVHAHTSERNAINVAIRFIDGMGHTTAGYLGANDGGWEEERGKYLRDAGRKNVPAVKVICYEDAYRETLGVDYDNLKQRLLVLSKSPSLKVRKTIAFLTSCITQANDCRAVWQRLAQQLLLWPSCNVRSRGCAEFAEDLRAGTLAGVNPRLFHNMEVLLPFLLSENVTCLILPRDRSTRVIYTTLTGIGLSVPDDISLISFDNYMTQANFPVTAVDFGFDNLGYRTIHYLLRDLPHTTGTESEIISQPKLVRRGSVKRLF